MTAFQEFRVWKKILLDYALVHPTSLETIAIQLGPKTEHTDIMQYK